MSDRDREGEWEVDSSVAACSSRIMVYYVLSYLIPFRNLLDGTKEEERRTFTGQRENTSTATVWTQPCNEHTNSAYTLTNTWAWFTT